METLKELNEYINKFLVNEEFLKIYNEGKPLEIYLNETTIYSNRLSNNHDLIRKMLKNNSHYTKFNGYKIKNDIIVKNFKTLFSPFENIYKDDNGRNIDFLNLHIYESNGNEYFLPTSHLNKFTMKVEEPLREQMNKKVPQISKKLISHFKKDLIHIKENLINELGFDPKKLRTFKNGYKAKDINGIEKEYFRAGNKVVEINDFYRNVKMQIDSLKSMKNIKDIEKFYIIIKPYIEEFNKYKNETKHIPSAPDTSKFMAVVYGDLGIRFNEWISSSNKYSSFSSFAPLVLTIGGNFPTELKNELTKLIAFIGTNLNIKEESKYGTSYSTFMIQEVEQNYTYENNIQSVSGKYVFNKDRLENFNIISKKIHSNTKNDLNLEMA
jgi:hypothetical protein